MFLVAIRNASRRRLQLVGRQPRRHARAIRRRHALAAESNVAKNDDDTAKYRSCQKAVLVHTANDYGVARRSKEGSFWYVLAEVKFNKEIGMVRVIES